MNARLLQGTWNFFSTCGPSTTVFSPQLICSAFASGHLCLFLTLFILQMHTPLNHNFQMMVFLLNSTYEKLSFTFCNIMSPSIILLQSEHLEWGLGFQEQQSFQVCYLYPYTHFHLNIWVSSGLQQTWNSKVTWFSTLPKYFVLPSKEPGCWGM